MDTNYKSSRKNNYIVPVIMMLLIIVAIGVRISIMPDNENIIPGCGKDKVAAGLSFLEGYNTKDIAEIENAIDEAERRHKAELIENGDMNAIYSRVLIMGDSHMEGMLVYGFLDGSKVAAVKGRSLATCDEDIAKAANVLPSTILMNYGMNDAMSYGSDVDSFINKYKEVINRLHEVVPSAKIVICSIFPAQEDVFARKPALANVPEYNKALKEMCKDEGLTFVDTTSLMTPDVYEPDHIHTNVKFHKIWLGYVADAAGLLDL